MVRSSGVILSLVELNGSLFNLLQKFKKSNGALMLVYRYQNRVNIKCSPEEF